jgi:hypothetical protein
MKIFHRILVLAVFVCTGTLQIGPAAAQLKTQTVEYKQADTLLEGVPRLIHRRDGMTDFTRKHADGLDQTDLTYILT